MALRASVTIEETGISVTDAIHRIECVTIHGKNIMAFAVRSYVNEDAESAFAERAYECAYDIAGSNPLQQGYEHLKSLTEFHGAVDA